MKKKAGKVDTIKGRKKYGEITAICVSEQKGTQKYIVKEAVLKEKHGIVNDAHAGSNRQVSLLAEESIKKIKEKGLDVDHGAFGENIVTKGIDIKGLPLSAKLKIGKNVILEVIQIGKECHARCAIYYTAGDCIMPREGIFANVISGGVIKDGDRMEVIRNGKL